MKHRERVQFLAKQPRYRTKLAYFFVLSIAVFSVSFLVKDPVTSEILLEFAVTFGAVGVLQVLWDILGGEPTELRIDELEEEMKDIQSSLEVLVHLTDSEVGLERIWARRGDWQEDENDGLKAWREWVCQAKKVDIVSNTLLSNWMSDRKFRQEFFEHIEHGAEVSILIYEPGSLAQLLRAEDEGEEPNSTKAMIKAAQRWLTEDEMDEPGNLKAEITAMLLKLGGDEHDMSGSMEREIEETLKEARSALSEKAWQNLTVGLTHFSLHPAQIIRADDRMLVSTYLAGEGGSSSPTMQIRGKRSKLYKTYENQFEILWDRAEILDETQLGQYLT